MHEWNKTKTRNDEGPQPECKICLTLSAYIHSLSKWAPLKQRIFAYLKPVGASFLIVIPNSLGNGWVHVLVQIYTPPVVDRCILLNVHVRRQQQPFSGHITNIFAYQVTQRRTSPRCSKILSLVWLLGTILMLTKPKFLNRDRKQKSCFYQSEAAAPRHRSHRIQ